MNSINLPFLALLVILAGFSIFNIVAIKSEKEAYARLSTVTFLIGLLLVIGYFIYFIIRKNTNFDSCFITSQQGFLMVAVLALMLVLFVVLYSSNHALRKIKTNRGIQKFELVSMLK
jgi:sugar phosphate permease